MSGIERNSEKAAKLPVLEKVGASGTRLALFLAMRMFLNAKRLVRRADKRGKVGFALALGIAVLVAPDPAHADVAILPVSGSNTTPAEEEVVGVLLADAYAEVSRQTAFEPAVTGPALQKTGSAGAAATLLKANEFVSVRIVKLDTYYSLRASRYTATGVLIHSARITADSLDDVAPAADRLARALFHKTSTTQARTIDNVTSKERTTSNRVKTEVIAGVKVGLTFAVATGKPIVPMMTIGYNGRHEGENYFVEWGAGVVVPTDSDNGERRSYGGLHLEVGGSYYLTQSLISPYVGAGVLPRFLTSNVSLAPYAQAGLMFFRHSSTRIYTDVRLAQHVLPQSYESPLSGEVEEDRAYPTEFTFSVGVGF